jgi:CBS domain containing-hemolysin-like protein
VNPLVWAAIALLISVNALYVAAEFSAVSVRRTMVRQLAETGSPAAIWVLPMVQDSRLLDRFVAGCQIGITLSSLVLGAFGQATLARELAPVLVGLGGLDELASWGAASLIVLVGLVTLQVVLGELVPKSLALQHPARVLLLTAWPMRLSLKLYSWSIALLNGSAILVLRAMRIKEDRPRHIHSPEEIELLVAESCDGGLLEPEEQRRLRRALKLGSRPVESLMVSRMKVEMLDSETPLEELVRTVSRSTFTRFPVYRGSTDNVIGMVHARDLAVLQISGEAGRTSLETLLRPVLVVTETVRIDRLITMFREQHSQMAIVVDEFGGFAGLATLEDVLGAVFGTLDDEFKSGRLSPRLLDDGWVRLPGALPLDEAAPWVGVEWKGKAVTVGGFVTERLGHLPAEGEMVEIDGVEVQVERVVRHAVGSVLARPLSEEAEEE